MNTKIKGYTCAVVSAVAYGMIPLFALPLKQSGFSFDTALFYRFLFSALIIGAFLLYKKVDLKVSRRDLGALFVLAMMYYSSSEFLFLGYDYLAAGVASTILFVYPVFVALILGLGFKEKISWVVWGAIGLTVTGVALLNSADSGGFSSVGMVIVLLSALSYALYMVMVNKSRLSGMNGMKVSFYSLFFCALFFLGKSFALGNDGAIPSVEVGVNLLLFALVPTIVSLLTLVYAIQFIGSTPTAIMGSMEPVVAVGISVALFGELFTVNLLAGILLILAAVLLTVLAEPISKWLEKLLRHRKYIKSFAK